MTTISTSHKSINVSILTVERTRLPYSNLMIIQYVHISDWEKSWEMKNPCGSMSTVRLTYNVILSVTFVCLSYRIRSFVCISTQDSLDCDKIITDNFWLWLIGSWYWRISLFDFTFLTRLLINWLNTSLGCLWCWNYGSDSINHSFVPFHNLLSPRSNCFSVELLFSVILWPNSEDLHSCGKFHGCTSPDAQIE